MDVIFLLIFLYLLFKRKYAWVLFGIILLTTNYLGSGTNLSNFPVRHNVSDSGLLLYLGLCLHILINNAGKLRRGPFYKYLIIFFLFLFTSTLVDIFVNRIDLVDILKTSRHWVFITCFLFFYYVPEKDLQVLLKILLVASFVISVISLVSFLFHIELFGPYYIETTSSLGHEFRRGRIPSILNFFVIYLLSIDYFKVNRFTKYCLIIILSLVIVVSMIRSWIIALLIGFVFVIISSSKARIKNIISGISLAIIVTLLVLSNPNLKDRFQSGYNELQRLSNYNSAEGGNVTFRAFHIQERLNYVESNFQYAIFGIGNVVEDDFPSIFRFGLKDKYGRLTQLDTADNAWSLLFIRLGIGGTIIYLIFYSKYLLLVLRLCFMSKLALAISTYLLVNLLIISFASSTIANGSFWILPALVYSLIVKNQEILEEAIT